MSLQGLIAAAVVLACGLYAVWTLMPAALRRPLAAGLLRWPGLQGRAWLRQAAQAKAAGCGCEGCDAAARPAPGAPQRMIVMRRKAR